MADQRFNQALKVFKAIGENHSQIINRERLTENLSPYFKRMLTPDYAAALAATVKKCDG
jgi:hypothetical protein